MFSKFKSLKSILIHIHSLIFIISLLSFILFNSFYNFSFSKTYNEYLFNNFGINNFASQQLDDIKSSTLKLVTNNQTVDATKKNAINSLIETITKNFEINENVSNLRNGLIDYLKNEKDTFPEVVVINKSDAKLLNSLEFKAFDRIGLNTILFYLNKNDIVNSINSTKNLLSFVKNLSNLNSIFLFFLLTLAILIYKEKKTLKKWFNISLLYLLSFSISIIVVFMFFSKNIIRFNVYKLSTFFPLDLNLAQNYIFEFTLPIIYSLLFTIALIILTYILFRNLKFNFINKIVSKFINGLNNKFNLSNFNLFNIKLSTYIRTALILTFFCLLLFKSNSFINDTNENYQSVFSTIIGQNFEQKIIYAKDQSVYSIQVKLTEKGTSAPINDIKTEVSGISFKDNKNYYYSGVTSSEGVYLFQLDKGYYRLNFSAPVDKNKYLFPTSFFVTVDKPGITQINLVLETKKTEKTFGIAEIELLDSNDKPIENAEFILKNKQNILNPPDIVKSITNSEGIAIFNINIGDYDVSLNPKTVPINYIPKDDFKITIIENSISRYTLKLAKFK